MSAACDQAPANTTLCLATELTIMNSIIQRAASAPFLRSLWSMLEDEGNAQTISWSFDGASFEIFSPELLAEEVLPQYFRHNNFASFQRQLNYL